MYQCIPYHGLCLSMFLWLQMYGWWRPPVYPVPWFMFVYVFMITDVWLVAPPVSPVPWFMFVMFLWLQMYGWWLPLCLPYPGLCLLCFYDYRCEYGWWLPLCLPYPGLCLSMFLWLQMWVWLVAPPVNPIPWFIFVYVLMISDLSKVGGAPCESRSLVYVCLCFNDFRCEYGWWLPLCIPYPGLCLSMFLWLQMWVWLVAPPVNPVPWFMFVYVFMITDVSMVGGAPWWPVCLMPWFMFVTDVSMVGGAPLCIPYLGLCLLCCYDYRCEYGWWRPLWIPYHGLCLSMFLWLQMWIWLEGSLMWPVYPIPWV